MQMKKWSLLWWVRTKTLWLLSENIDEQLNTQVVVELLLLTDTVEPRLTK